jgi:predicted N-acetyltransferase YhbS
VEGPRAVRPDELQHVSGVVDRAFPSHEASMFQRFPMLFNEINCENMLVMADAGRIVSHVAMLQHRAIIGGCRIAVACFGAVATEDAYRRRGLASQLYTAAREKAYADGVDIMLISGDLEIYTRAGAAACGLNVKTLVAPNAAGRIRNGNVSVSVANDSGISRFDAAYRSRNAHFVRSPDEWKARLAAGYCMGRKATLFDVCDSGGSVGYIALSIPAADGTSRVCEFAGAPHAVASALPLVIEATGAASIEIELQHEDAELRSLLESVGCAFENARSTDTVLLINPLQLFRKLQPLFEERAGVMDADRLGLIRYGDALRITIDGSVKRSMSPAEAVRFIFGHHGEAGANGLLGEVFPAPNLSYGYNYV